MNVIKSIIVVICLLAIISFTVVLLVKLFNNARKGMLTKTRSLLTTCCCAITIISIVVLGDYAYPFERPLNPVLIAEFDVPEEYALDYPGQKFWHGAYEAYGLYAESFYFDPSEPTSIYGIAWPPMNFDRYSYVITYGQKIDTLSYNVWETIDTPIRTGAKVGHMVLEDSFSPRKVYIYQIPKIRIENNINGKVHPEEWK